MPGRVWLHPARVLGRVSIGAIASTIVWLAIAASALAGPVATSDGQYQAQGRVFPDPLGGCQYLGTSPCDPRAEGNIGAKSFVGYSEFVGGILYMNQRKEWQRYMEVWPLDGKLDTGKTQSSGNARTDVPGNNLPASELEFEPNPSFISAGVPQTDQSRLKSDLIVVRVTDETVPDAGKKRYALSLSIHGIERAGAEGGIRAMEDLATAVSTEGKLDQPILPRSVREGAPKIRDVLANTIIYFTFPNPDGWRRGSIQDGGLSFQRYNGNGMDPNRDWPDIGFAYRFFSGVSEPETKALTYFFKKVRERGPFAAGDDLHGQPFADALSYTMLPHGSHDWDKDIRLQEAAKRINTASYDATKWSPIIQSNDAPPGGGPPCAPPTLGTACAKVYAQTWGTVYDTINYTTTGALGDWFDSSIGLHAEGIDNEMSFSHLDKDTRFDPHTEQLHVAGNKAIIFSHIAQFLDPPQADFDAPGTKGFVPNKRLHRDEQNFDPQPPPGTVAQSDVDGDTDSTFPFTVKGGPQGADGSPDAGKDIFNGGMRVEVTVPNLQGVTPDAYPVNQVDLKVQCQKCDRHRGTTEGEAGDEWVTVAEDFNQKQLYLAAGLTASVNQPQAFDAEGKPIKWRVLLDGQPPGFDAHVHIVFMQTAATTSGNTGGDTAPKLLAYDVANTDFISGLNKYIPTDTRKFKEVDPRKVISGEQSLGGLNNLVLADDPLPGFTGSWGNEPQGPPPADFEFKNATTTHPGAYQSDIPPEARSPGSYETHDFTIKPEEAAFGVDIKMSFPNADDDWDLYLYRKAADGSLETVGSSTGGSGVQEEIKLENQIIPAGDYVIYVDNWAATDPTFTVKVTFQAVPPPPSDTGEYSNEQRDAWVAKLKDYVSGGGNLVLTDGALRALAGVAGIDPRKIGRTTVYAGQVAFEKAPGEPTNKDPLATAPLTLNQRGARFNSGMRKQTYEPTPIGFAISTTDKAGSDDSTAVEWDIDRKAFEAVPNSRLVGTSVNSGARDASTVHDRVSFGEVKLGSGQVRFIGALLPQPTEKFDHEFGLEPHAVTVAGYILFRNMLASKEEQAAGTLSENALFYKRKPRFLISNRLTRMSLKGIVPLRVSCRSKGGCRGTIRIFRSVKVKVKTKTSTKTVTRKRVISSRKFRVKANRRATLKMKLMPTGRAAVRRKPRTKVAASASVIYKDGRRETVGPVRFKISRPKG